MVIRWQTISAPKAAIPVSFQPIIAGIANNLAAKATAIDIISDKENNFNFNGGIQF